MSRKLVPSCSILLVLVTWCYIARSLDIQEDRGQVKGRRLGSSLSSRRKVSAPIQDEFETLAAPDKHYVLRLTIIRIAVIFYVGPCVLFYGTTFKKATSLIQAVTASGLWTWWVKLQSIAYWSDVPPVIQDFGVLLFFSSAVGFSMLSAELLNLCVKGGLLGHLFIMRILDIVEVNLLEQAGCDSARYMPALAIRNMNFDTWVGCTKKDQYYLGVFMLKGMDWFFVILGMLVATRMRQSVGSTIGILTAAMLGADFIGAAIEAGIADIMALDSSPEEVARAMKTFLWYRMFLQYALAAAGFYTQMALVSWLRNKQTNSTWSTDDPRRDVSMLVRPFTYFHYVAAPLFTVDRAVESAMKSYADKVAKHVAGSFGGQRLSRSFSTIDKYNLKVAPDSGDVRYDSSRTSSHQSSPEAANTMKLLLRAAMELSKTNGEEKYDDDEESVKPRSEGTPTTSDPFKTPMRPARLELRKMIKEKKMKNGVADENDPLSPTGEGTPPAVTPLKLAAEGETSPLSSNITMARVQHGTMRDDDDDNATNPASDLNENEVAITTEEEPQPDPEDSGRYIAA